MGDPTDEGDQAKKDAEAAAKKEADAQAKAEAEAAAIDEAEAGIPVSSARVEYCLGSARFWVRELPRFADVQQRSADRWSLAAGVLSALTGLAIWPVLEAQANLSGANGTTADPLSPAAIVISLVAFAAAICALVPRVKNYGENAGQAREIASRYGAILGDLIDLHESKPFDQQGAKAVVKEFESVKAKKDGLRGLRLREQVERDEAIAKAQARASVAKANGLAVQAEQQAAPAVDQPRTGTSIVGESDRAGTDVG